MLPFFVYGTLLPDQPNYPLWEDAVERLTPATLSDATLFSMGHFPMMVECAGKQVQGVLVEISAESYPKILAKIDRLEGFMPHDPNGSLYQRRSARVQTADRQIVKAWTYFGDRVRTQGCLAIGGDWVRFSAEKRHDIDRWWQQQRRESALLF